MPRYPLVPRPSHRAHPFVAAVWLALVLIPVLAGCRRVTDLTHVPTPLQPTSPTTPTTPTDAATSTPTPRPTWTPRPTVDAAVPLPVAMTLEEARAEVWSWLDSAHAPRIVSVDYVAGAAVETDRFMTRQPLVFDSQVDMDFAELLAGRRLPTTVVRVVAEFAPLDAPLYRQIDDLRGVGEPRSVVPARLVAMFDATTGARLALMSAETRQVDVLETTLAAPTVPFTFQATVLQATATADRATSMPMPSATTIPTPIGPTVEAASVPPAMHEVLTAYPLLPGSTWTWESTSLNNRVTWTRSRMTDRTVEPVMQPGSCRGVLWETVRKRVDQQVRVDEDHQPCASPSTKASTSATLSMLDNRHRPSVIGWV